MTGEAKDTGYACGRPKGEKLNRTAFLMRLRPGSLAEYVRRHDSIWQDLVAELKGAGVFEFEIYVGDDEQTLFALCTTHDSAGDLDSRQPGGPVQRRWWAYMEPLMVCNDDDSPTELPLRRVFELK